jgi:hypothetical protein
MIPFFIKIRKKLADENKPQKIFKRCYWRNLTCSFGMLMALQINNSNELRKNKEERAIILLAKKEDFIATRLNFLQTSKKQQNNFDVIEVKINLL